MICAARVLPTPGRASSSADTRIRVTTSSLEPSTSCKDVVPARNAALNSERSLRIADALAKAAKRCSSVSDGRGIPET